MTHAERLLLGPGRQTVLPRVMEALQRPTSGISIPDKIPPRARTRSATDCVPCSRRQYVDALPMSGYRGRRAWRRARQSDRARRHRDHRREWRVRRAHVRGGVRCGAEVVRVDEPWGSRDRPRSVCSTRAWQPCAVLAVVHAETSTGLRTMWRPSPRSGRNDTLLVVDSGHLTRRHPVAVDEWLIGRAYSGQSAGCRPVCRRSSLAERGCASAIARSRRSLWYLDLGRSPTT